MDRRAFLALSSAVTAGAALSSKMTAGAQSAADVMLEVAPVKLEIAPGKVVHTVPTMARCRGRCSAGPKASQSPSTCSTARRSLRSYIGMGFGFRPTWTAPRKRVHP